MKKHLRLLFVSILLAAILCGGIAVRYIRNCAPAPTELASKTIQMPPAAVEPAPQVESVAVVEADTGRLAVPAEPEPEIRVTNPAFQAQLDILEAKLPETASIALTDVREIAPELAQMIEANRAAVFLLCSTDLLAPDNNEPLRDSMNEKPNRTTPTKRQIIECGLFRCLIDEYEPSTVELLKNETGFDWLAWFYRADSIRMCAEHGRDPTGAFYLEHPLRQQFLIAMLREPVWRMPGLTPLSGKLYDQDSYVDAFNTFYAFMEFGEQPRQLAVEPVPDNPRALCTETAAWTMTQTEDFTVTLEVMLENGEIVTLTYTP